MRLGAVIEIYDNRKSFKCSHCEEVTNHKLLKIRETFVEPERVDGNKVLLVWFCEYCLDSERVDRLKK